MPHSRQYDHETLMYFWNRALDLFKVSHPNAGYPQNTREINEKIKQLVDHLIWEYENVVYSDHFQEPDFRMNPAQAIAMIDLTLEFLKAAKPESNTNPSKQQIVERFHDIFDLIVWQYHWYFKHDCKRKE